MIPSSLSRRQFLYLSGASSVLLACNPKAALSQAPEEVAASWDFLMDLPFPVQEIYPVLHNGKVHLAGGFLAEGGQITDASVFHLQIDVQTKEVVELRQLPEKRHHPNLVSHRGKLYLLGGFVPLETGPWNMRAQTWVYDEGAYDVRASAPNPHGETVCTALEDHIHVVGGRRMKGTGNGTYQDHADSDQHLMYDPQADTWAELAPAPSKRNSAAGAVIEKRWYVVGGRTVTGGNVGTLEMYDPKEDKWATLAPMPQGQGGLAAAAVDGKLYAFGGEYFNDGGGVYPECWTYDPKKDKWEATTPMETPRHGLGGVALDGKIYAIGGAVKAGGNGTSTLIEVFTP
ncbi:MAG: kelch repeat-containing protein [Bacteroidota bacterium]